LKFWPVTLVIGIYPFLCNPAVGSEGGISVCRPARCEMPTGCIAPRPCGRSPIATAPPGCWASPDGVCGAVPPRAWRPFGPGPPSSARRSRGDPPRRDQPADLIRSIVFTTVGGQASLARLTCPRLPFLSRARGRAAHPQPGGDDFACNHADPQGRLRLLTAFGGIPRRYPYSPTLSIPRLWPIQKTSNIFSRIILRTWRPGPS
jgi:hypothetical protein